MTNSSERHGPGAKNVPLAVVIVGIGELGGEFGRGFLRSGVPVYPLVRGMEPAVLAKSIPQPGLVLVTVGENDLDRVLRQMPDPWRNRVALVQNELMPRDWEKHHYRSISVAVVWFEKKPGQPLTNILDTPVYGPGAELLSGALKALGIPTRILENQQELVFELAKKSLYILTVNLAGLVVNGTVGELWHNHRPQALKVAREVLPLLEWRAGQALPEDLLLAGLAAAIDDCPHRPCTGRSARTRLQRALTEARQVGLDTPCLAEILRNIGSDGS